MTMSALLQGRLRPRLVARPDAVELRDYVNVSRRLVLVVDADLIESLGHYTFHKVVEDRGVLAQTSAPLATFVADAPEWASAAADWAAKGHAVDLAVVRPLPLHVATALVLVAAGYEPADAITEVGHALPAAEFDIDAEVSVSAFVYSLHAHRVWKEARRIARQGAFQ